MPYDEDVVNPSSSTDRVEKRERQRTDAHELSWAVRELTRMAAEVDTHLARRLNLRPLDNTALDHVMMADEPLGPLELSQRLGISSGSTTELVDRLERAGHLERRRDSQDRRRVSLHMTEPTVERVLVELRPLFDALDVAADQFTAEEQELIGRYLRSASQALRAYAHTDPS